MKVGPIIMNKCFIIYFALLIQGFDFDILI